MTNAILLGAAIGLVAALRGRKKADEEPTKEVGEDDWGIAETNELVKSGRYVGQLGEIDWRIYKDPDDLFFYEWKWTDNEGGGKGFTTLDEAEEALWQDMQGEVGLELVPEAEPEPGEPPVEPEPPLGPMEFAEETAEPEEPVTMTLVETGFYEGQRGGVQWSLAVDGNGLYHYTWSWSDNHGKGSDFPSYDAAMTDLFEVMESEVGPPAP
jgi:hypothetical protein